MIETQGAVATAQDLVAVGVDSTPQSKTASERATRVAQSTKSRRLDIHVVPRSAGEEAAPVVPTSAAEAGAAGVDSQPILCVGRPPEELAHAAESHGAWLLVLGVSPDIAPSETFLLGTTAELALRHGSTPVLLAREKASRPYGRVLLPLDADELSLRVLKTVARLAPGAEYEVVQFLPPNGSHESKTRAHREAVAATLTALCVEAGLAPERTRVRAFVAETRDGILGEVKHRPPDLVALGTHARKGIARIVLGSVADYVIHAAAGIDVLVVPPEK